MDNFSYWMIAGSTSVVISFLFAILSCLPFKHKTQERLIVVGFVFVLIGIFLGAIGMLKS